MKLLARWALLFAVWIIPYLLVLVVGWVWLYEHGLILWWILGSGVLALVAWYVGRRLDHDSAAVREGGVAPDENWTESAQRAWRQVSEISERTCQASTLPATPEAWWTLLHEVLRTVAREFHPRSERAELEIPIPHLLKVLELVASDLRGAFSEHVPGAHILTLNEFRRLRELTSRGSRWYRWYYAAYRIFHAGWNPVGALMRELKDRFSGDMYDRSVGGIRNWALRYVVQKAGYYSIQLYSGNLVLEGLPFETFRSHAARRDMQVISRRAEALQEEPLRILLLGQVKSGKSSLVNALFGEVTAPVDVLPATNGIQPYLLEREGVCRALILDSRGTAGADQPDAARSDLRQQLLLADLVLLVTSATSAARASDREWLDTLREQAALQPARTPPAVLVILTHVDQLRPFREWSPPYNLLAPLPGSKARQIVDAIQAVATDLGVELDRVIPVSLRSDSPYNVEEGVVCSIVRALPEAKRARYLRCLREFRDEEYWRRLWQQTMAGGRLVVRAARQAIWPGDPGAPDPNSSTDSDAPPRAWK